MSGPSRRDIGRVAARLPGAEHARRNRRLRELTRRFGFEPANPRPEPPLRPVGAKLELTYACNLRCGFCYTDSPRRTLERAQDLTDDEWNRVVSDTIATGVVEAVVTGGEPLLRKDLALAVLERLDATGIATTMNTNGWFVDPAVADRLAGLGLATVNISLDGPTPEVHDRARGVPGSWRRAVRAISLLLERSVPVRVVHVVTPDNQALVEGLIEQLRALGVSALRIAPVVEIGAAARGEEWTVSLARLQRTLKRVRRDCEDLDIRLEQGTVTGDPTVAPAYFLVRPNGAVISGGLSPFRFGHALEDGLSECWRRIRTDWRHPVVEAWREAVRHGQPLSQMPVVLYRNDEIDLYADGQPATASLAPMEVRLPKPARATQGAGAGDLIAAGAYVRKLTLERRLRASDVRWTDASASARYVRNALGGVSLLNETARIVMDACSPGTGADAVARLGERYPQVPADRLERDALSTLHRLLRGGVLTYAAAGSTSPRASSTSTTASASARPLSPAIP